MTSTRFAVQACKAVLSPLPIRRFRSRQHPTPSPTHVAPKPLYLQYPQGHLLRHRHPGPRQRPGRHHQLMLCSPRPFTQTVFRRCTAHSHTGHCFRHRHGRPRPRPGRHHNQLMLRAARPRRPGRRGPAVRRKGGAPRGQQRVRRAEQAALRSSQRRVEQGARGRRGTGGWERRSWLTRVVRGF